MTCVGQTKYRIMERFPGHIFYIKHVSSTTVAGHFATTTNLTDPEMTIHILK